jgi:hypothetical protein
MSATVELQIFISLVVILGAAFVALVCDFLKGNNEHLREQNLELRIRKEELERRNALEIAFASRAGGQTATGGVAARSLMRVGLQHAAAGTASEQTTAKAESQPPASPAVPVGITEGMTGGRRRHRKVAAELSESIKEIASMVEAKSRGLEKPAVAVVAAGDAEPQRAGQELTASAAVLESTPEAIVERTQEVVLVGVAPLAAEPMQAAAVTPLLDALAGRDLLEQAIEFTARRGDAAAEAVVDAPVAEPEQTPVQELAVVEPVPVDAETLAVQTPDRQREFWRDVVIEFGEARQAIEARKAEKDPVREAVAETTQRVGIQDASVLASRLSANGRFRGLAMIVGINDYAALRGRSGFNQSEVDRLIESLTESKHVACRTSEDEFVLLFENVIGRDAQSKSAAVSERLWDFQLRNIGSFMIAFSWGACEAAGEPLSTCLENARDEMRSTRRGRLSTARGRAYTAKAAVNL